MNADNNSELFPAVDPDGNVLDCITRGHAHDGSLILHPVVHVHVFNSKGELYLQHRPSWKPIQPDKWDTACGGHIEYGESVPDAMAREVREELGIDDLPEVEPLGKYVFESKVERELVYAFRVTYDGPVIPSADELDGGRFWSCAELAEAMGKGIFTPNLESELVRWFGVGNIQ